MDGESAGQPNEERRLVTVLFADVCGSTQLGERSDPEDVRALLAAFFVVAREVMEEHGGRLEKFIGDAVMAIFGLPVAHDDDAARAVSAGIDLRDRVRAAPGLGEQLPIRIGVHTGEVVATRDTAAGDFLITGDAVNTSARLQQAADPWDVLVSERTARATGDRFGWEGLQDVEARGKAASVPARRVLGRRASAGSTRLPLVNRVADMRLLELTAERAFVERRPYLVTILAAAGTGKTRLAEEFLGASLLRVAPTARVVSVQCLPCGEQPACSPLRGLLLGLLEVEDGMPPDVMRAAVRGWLAERDHPDPDRMADLLLSSIGEGEQLSANQPAVFSAWRAVLQLAARTRPLVLHADDLHASTETFIDLLQFAIAPEADVPLLGLVLARTELVDRRPDWASGHRNSLMLALAPLSDDDMATLVAAHLGRSTHALVRRIVDRAAGNPFFAEELVRALAEPGSLGAEGAGPMLPGAVALPDTIQATLLARMDLLGPAARRILQLGSVFGARFPLEGVLALDPTLTPDASDALRTLEQHDLVGTDAGEAASFRHALIQETAYQTLTRRDRAAQHAAAARWIEEHGHGREDQLAEVIGYHWHQAATLIRATSEVGMTDVGVQAAAWLRRAADADLRRWAGPEAVGHLRQAVEIAPRGELPALHERIGDVVQSGDESVVAYETALRLHEEAGSGPDDRLRLIGKQILVHARTQGAVAKRITADRMERLVDDGASLVDIATDQEAVARYLIACGFLPYWGAGGDTVVSEGVVLERRRGTERGLSLAIEIQNGSLQSCALDALSGIAQSLGRHREARDHARSRFDLQGVELGEQLDACAFVAWESCLLGDYLEAGQVTDLGLSLMGTSTGLLSAIHLLAWRAYALTMLGDDSRALDAARGAESAWTDTGKGAAAYAVHAFLAALEICRAADDDRGAEHWKALVEEVCAPLEARSFGQTALHIARADRPALLDVVAHPVALGERSHLVERALNACLDRGWLPAEEHLQALLTESLRQGLDPLAAQARRGLGLVRASRQDLDAAWRLARRMRSRRLAVRIESELDRLSGPPRQPSSRRRSHAAGSVRR